MRSPEIQLYNVDCLPFLIECGDKQFDLAIVDPPYGINVNMNAGKKKGESDRYENKDWDKSIPSDLYFKHLRRVSKNTIIWGCNYFSEFLWSPGRISWFKNNGSNNDFSDCEIAMNTFNNRVTNVSIQWSGFIKPKSEIGSKRIHPTQKPVQLYEWILMKYAKSGDLILDTHLGSGSIGIACWNLGFDLTACEIDKDYFDAANERINIHKNQLKLF